MNASLRCLKLNPSGQLCHKHTPTVTCIHVLQQIKAGLADFFVASLPHNLHDNAMEYTAFISG